MPRTRRASPRHALDALTQEPERTIWEVGAVTLLRREAWQESSLWNALRLGYQDFVPPEAVKQRLREKGLGHLERSVRDAMRQLVARGLLEKGPNQGEYRVSHSIDSVVLWSLARSDLSQVPWNGAETLSRMVQPPTADLPRQSVQPLAHVVPASGRPAGLLHDDEVQGAIGRAWQHIRKAIEERHPQALPLDVVLRFDAPILTMEVGPNPTAPDTLAARLEVRAADGQVVASLDPEPPTEP